MLLKTNKPSSLLAIHLNNHKFSSSNNTRFVNNLLPLMLKCTMILIYRTRNLDVHLYQTTVILFFNTVSFIQVNCMYIHQERVFCLPQGPGLYIECVFLFLKCSFLRWALCLSDCLSRLTEPILEIDQSEHLGQSVMPNQRLGCIRWMDMWWFATFCQAEVNMLRMSSKE